MVGMYCYWMTSRHQETRLTHVHDYFLMPELQKLHV
jgi:hypothetical protein